MVGPPLLGGLSELFNGLRWSFAVDAGIVLAVSVVALTLKIRQERRLPKNADYAVLNST